MSTTSFNADICPGARYWLAWKDCIEFVEVVRRETQNTWQVRPTVFLDYKNYPYKPTSYIVTHSDLYIDPIYAAKGRAAALRSAPPYTKRKG